MKLTDAQMESFVLSCENRLGQLNNAQLMEFEAAMESTFMPHIRTQLEIFDTGRGFSVLPGVGFPEIDDLGRREDTFPALPSLSTSPLPSPSDDMTSFFDFEEGGMPS